MESWTESEIPAMIKLTKIRQVLDDHRIDDVAGCLRQELGRHAGAIRTGARIAIGVGSRGIANLPAMVKELCRFVIEHGASPFIIPAMGSHGGATAEGQAHVLECLGICESAIGVPVISSMEVVELPSDELKNRVYMDRHAWESDGVILINRIKPHTDFHSTYESGLVKMSVIGLGNHHQAKEIHRFGVEGLKQLIPATAEKILATGKIIMGVAVVENAGDETAAVHVLDPDQFMKEEPMLLEIARNAMPSLPADHIDVLVIDRMGKDISGTGIDPNIIGRICIKGQKDPDRPDIRFIVVSDLTPASHGNALGIGLADIMTRRLFEKIDLKATYENVLTTNFLERGKLPIVAEDSRQALEIALRACGPVSQGAERIVRIRDTLSLEQLYVSAAILEEIRGRVTVLERDIEFEQCRFSMPGSCC